MVKTYQQKNEHELNEAIKSNNVNHVYVETTFGEKVEVSKGEILSVLYELFKRPEKKVKAVHIQDAIYLK